MSSSPPDPSPSAIPKVVAAIIIAAAAATGAYVAGNGSSTLKAEMQTALSYDAAMPVVVPSVEAPVVLRQVLEGAAVYGGGK